MNPDATRNEASHKSEATTKIEDKDEPPRPQSPLQDSHQDQQEQQQQDKEQAVSGADTTDNIMAHNSQPDQNQEQTNGEQPEEKVEKTSRVQENLEEKKDEGSEAPISMEPQQQHPHEHQQVSQQHLQPEPRGRQQASTPNRGRQSRQPAQQPSPPPQAQAQAQAQQSYKSTSSTEIVHSMFGPSVGLCYGDFSCQYKHIRGRLYACSEAILFYSNLFGFEKKFCFRYDAVLEMELYRATSIRICIQEQPATNNDSSTYDYIFKTFSDRVQTLQLLIDLWQQSQGAENIEAANEAEGATTAADNNDNHIDNNNMPLENASQPSLDALSPTRPISPTGAEDDITAMISKTQPPTTNLHNHPPSILRSSKAITPQRSNPTSQIQNDPNTTPKKLFPAPSGKRPKSLPPLHRRRTRARANSDGAGPGYGGLSDDMHLDKAPKDSDRAAWHLAKTSADPCIQDIGMEPFSLACSLDAFFKLFLADKAPHSFGVYQKSDAVLDLDIQISPWKQDPAEKAALVRTLEFRHPVSKSLGIGPSHTPTKKQQRLQRFPGCGLCLTNATTVEGIPSSDCFVVMDHWIVESCDNTDANAARITLSANFGANFTKRTFLKGIIQKNIRSATKEWFAGYKNMVQVAMQNQPNSGVTGSTTSIADDSSSKSNPIDGAGLRIVSNMRLFLVLAVVAQILLLLCLLLVVQELRSSQHTSEGLLEEMKHLRLEHGQILNLLLTAKGGDRLRVDVPEN